MFGKTNSDYAEYKVVAIVVDEDDVELKKSGRVVEYPNVDKLLADYTKDGWSPIAMNMDPQGYAFLLGRGKNG